jgi:hypothetical protein
MCRQVFSEAADGNASTSCDHLRMRIGKWWIGRWWSQGENDRQVIFSLSVHCDFPIEALAPMRNLTRAVGKPRADNDVMYSIGKTISFRDAIGKPAPTNSTRP